MNLARQPTFLSPRALLNIFVSMTIIITITRGLIARNILQNNFFEIVKAKFDRVVIITIAADDKRFVEQFQSDRVEIVSCYPEADTWLDKLVSKLNTYLIYNINTKKLSLYNTINPRHKFLSYFKYIVLRMIFQPLAQLKILRQLIGYFDYLFLQSKTVKKYQKLLRAYQPKIVFSTNMIESPDIEILKAARKEKIKTMAMCKSWDNPSKIYFRARADRVAVWGKFMADQMQAYQDYKPKNIITIGVPQFDYYLDKSRLVSRVEFCRQYNLDPTKKIILFGSEGKLVPTEPEVVKIISDLIDNRELAADCQILIRPHFGYKKDYLKFSKLEATGNVKLDLNNNPSVGFRDEWDYSNEQMNNFLNTMYHSDVTVNTCSTLTLDAAVLQKPVILNMFDGYQKLPFYQSAARWYYSDYYSKLMEYDAALEAHNADELKESLNILLKQPNLLAAQQVELAKDFCYQVDGKAGQRLFRAIDSLISG